MSMVNPPGLGTGEPLVEVDRLGKNFGARSALKDLSLRLWPGQVLGFIGANGGGKTTALRLIAGLLKADTGCGHVLGHDLLRSRSEIRQHIGYMSQHFSLYPDLTVLENLVFRAGLYDLPRPHNVAIRSVAEFGLEDFSRQRAGRLSGGWARRLQFAAALIHSPRLVLLDEPTAGLDLSQTRETWRRVFALAAAGAGVIISTHDLVEAERCWNVAYFVEGTIRASGSPGDLISRSAATALGTAAVQARGLEAVADLLSARRDSVPIKSP